MHGNAHVSWQINCGNEITRELYLIGLNRNKFRYDTRNFSDHTSKNWYKSKQNDRQRGS